MALASIALRFVWVGGSLFLMKVPQEGFQFTGDSDFCCERKCVDGNGHFWRHLICVEGFVGFACSRYSYLNG